MTSFLLDTHIWLWYLGGSQRLPQGLRRLMDAGRSDFWVSPISVWETGMLLARGRIRLPVPLRSWIDQALETFPVNEAAVNKELALVSQEVKLPHQDPADHFLAATALVYELVLMTVDERLTKLKWLPTRSG